MLDSLAPARRRLVLVVLGVLVVAVVAGAAAVVVPRVLRGSGPDQGDPGPVVLVPGYGGNVSDLDPLVAHVRDQGRQAFAFDPPGDGTGDLRREASALADYVDGVRRRTGAASVDLVGYSAGGIVARLYVVDDGGDQVVRRVLTIGTPHHGTDVARQAEEAGGCPVGCEQLATGSSLLQRLDAGDETPDGQRWVTVRSDSDRTVVPTATAQLQGALNLRVQTFCDQATTGHGSLPADPVTLAALDRTIAVGEPERPREVRCG